MADTERTRAELESLLADNTSGAISAQDIRDFLASAVLAGDTTDILARLTPLYVAPGDEGTTVPLDGELFRVDAGIGIGDGVTVAGSLPASVMMPSDNDLQLGSAAVTAHTITASAYLYTTYFFTTYVTADNVETEFIFLNKTLLGTTTTNGLVMRNTTEATDVDTVQMSPRIRLQGQAWKSDATAASHQHDFIIENLPATGGASTTSALRIRHGLNLSGGASSGYTDVASFSNSGVATANAHVSKKQTLTDAATVTVNADGGSLMDLLLTSAVGATRLLGNPTGGVDGQRIELRIKQSATGSNAITFDTKYRFNTDIPGMTLTTTPDKTDRLLFAYHSTDDKWDAVAFQRGS